MLPFLFIAVAASNLPLYDVERSCRMDTEALGDNGAYESCLKDEQTAKETVGRDWGRYSAAARQACVPDDMGDFGNSYVEMMTCFEIQDWKTHLDDVGGSVMAGPASNGGSPPTPSQIGGYTASHPLGGIPGAVIR
jgi:hypothetical protein